MALVALDWNNINKYYWDRLAVGNCSFSLKPMSEEKVCRLPLNVKATGFDGITARFVGDAAECIAATISHIVNVSMAQGTVSEKPRAGPTSQEVDSRLTRLHPKHHLQSCGKRCP